MIELRFKEFYEQNYDDEDYCLYVMKNGLGDVLYVGISTADVWSRWFGWGGHMTWDGKIIYGESPIGTKIENNLPNSLNWNIQLWTLKDCLLFCRNEIPDMVSEITIHDVEPIMIQKLSPVLNATYNLNPGRDKTPKSQNETILEQKADTAYKKIFNKK